MDKSLLKDIFPYLSNNFPNRKVYIISDQHFYHYNILNLVRTEFDDINEMHDYIISNHNQIVGEDDIVLFLGDFSFKNNEIKNINNKVNGIKFLLMGNHDSEYILKNFKELGFENVYMFPVKLKDVFLSHEPLANDEKDTIDYELRSKEFNKTQDKVNYHGHIHNSNLSDGYINTVTENLNYQPLYLTDTINDVKRDKKLINSNIFDDVVNEVSRKYSCTKEHVIKDFLYTSSLEHIKNYQDSLYIFGSYGFYRKYNYISNFSDLDISILYKDNLSKKKNFSLVKSISDEITQLFNSYDMCEIEFYKRFQGIYILFLHYINGKGVKINTAIDMSCTPIAFDKPSDFIEMTNKTLIEDVFPELNNQYSLPSYSGKYYSNNSELSNLLIQLFFQKSFDENKIKIIKKINYLINRDESFNFNTLEETLIRHFIKNLYLLCSRSRYNEIEYINLIKKDLDIYINKLKPEIRDIIQYIFNDESSEFNKNYQEIFNLSNQKFIPNECQRLIKKRF